MIVVIADDITGAAEICGIGLRYGLKVFLSASVNTLKEEVDLLVIYTNSRSMPETEAVLLMHEMTKQIAELKPSLFYKKTDSVLRGHVLPEIKAHMDALKLQRALLLPANPLLGRTIQNGNYYVNGKPVHEAGFADDPEFPITNSQIEKMLRVAAGEVNILPLGADLPDGISIGQATSMKDVQSWASIEIPSIFYAGAASFFATLLQQRFLPKKTNQQVVLSQPVLLLSGTTYQRSIQQQTDYHDKMSTMPLSLFNDVEPDEKLMEKWADEIVSLLKNKAKCIATAGKRKEPTDPALLRKKMSITAKKVLEKMPVKDLLIEGGATAYAVVSELGFTAFQPTEELQQGVVRMKVMGVEGLHLTIKPGSYAWPREWLQVFDEKNADA